MKCNEHSMDILTDTKSLTDLLMPPIPPTYGVYPHTTCRYPLAQRHTGKHIDVWGCWTYGEVSKHGGPPASPYNMHIPSRTTDVHGSIGDKQGVFAHMGHWGCLNVWDIQCMEA